MQIARRSYATAGVAIAGAGLVAATPLALPRPDLPGVQSPAVRLTGAWEDAFNSASENATTLLNNYYLAPGVGLQQFIANQADYWDQLLNDPAGSSNAVAEEIQQHFNAVVTGFGLQDADSDTYNTVLNHTLDGTHNLMFGQIGGYLPDDVDPDQIMPIINFLASPQSAILMGMLGPAISPWVALINSVNDGDSFSDTLANMVGGYFNGATLNLDSLLPAINDAGFFPAGMSMDHLDFAFGGLLSTGGVQVGPYQVIGENGEIVASVPAVGSSLFNSVGIEFSGVPVLGTLDLDSQAIGPIGASLAWGQTVGALLGSGWDGKGPVDVTPPLAGVELPTIPTDSFDFDDGGAGSLASDSLSWLSDLLPF